jgi:pyruvate formate lyase activating enzyme
MHDKPVTPLASLQRAVEIGKLQGLKYVYSGNVPGDEGESTYCSNCRNRLIERHGFTVEETNLTGNKCAKCGTKVEGIF